MCILQAAMPRRLLSILLIGCLFIYEGGYLLYCSFRQQSLKKEMRAYVQEHNETFSNTFSLEANGNSITAAGFEWISKGEEFRYEGELFDVVSISYHDGKATIHAINDKQEEGLIKQIGRHHSDASNPAIVAWVASVFTPTVFNWQPATFAAAGVQYNIHPTPATPTVVLPVPLPPPNVA